MNNTEEETFRILSRRPFEEVAPTGYYPMDWTLWINPQEEKAFRDRLAECYWTENEYMTATMEFY